MTDRQAADARSAELLNELIECTRDGERFFLDAAAHADDRVPLRMGRLKDLYLDSGRAAP